MVLLLHIVRCPVKTRYYKLQIRCFDKTEWGNASPWDVLLFLKPDKLYTQSLNNPRSCHRAEFFSEWRKKSGFDLTATVPQPHCQGDEICCPSLEPGLHVFLEVEFAPCPPKTCVFSFPSSICAHFIDAFKRCTFPLWLLTVSDCSLLVSVICLKPHAVRPGWLFVDFCKNVPFYFM